VLPVPADYNPHWVYFKDAEGLLRLSTGEITPIPRRQELPVAFHRDGSVYAARRNVVMVQNSLYGTRVAPYVMDEAHSINIDDMRDWERAEQILLGRG
jgi:CMP-N,N'-diacetyllegionaminic acid synthase